MGGPLRLNFGLEGRDRQLLFQDLPQVMVKDRILDSWNLGTLIRGTANQADVSAFESEYAKVQSEESANKEALARILDLRNASGKGIQVENIRRIIAHFGGPTNDTGSPEVQAAVLTYRIRNLHDHLGSNRHDNSNRRSMSLLTHQGQRSSSISRGRVRRGITASCRGSGSRQGRWRARLSFLASQRLLVPEEAM